MPSQQAGRDVAERFALLLVLALFGATLLPGQVEVRGPHLFAGESRLMLRGVVYSPAPIGSAAGPSLDGAGCLYSRDFPLIASSGANAIRTLARVDPADRAFRLALADAGFYWLAGFPLEPYFDPSRSLDPAAPGGVELRERIVADFVDYARAWAGEPRLAALLFGNETGSRYTGKFAGERRHYYTLLAQAAAAVADAGLGVAVGASVGDLTEIGAFALSSTDPLQPDLALWAVDASGVALLGNTLHQARQRTSKALVLSGFGVDAFDQNSRIANSRQQGEIAALLAAEVSALERTPSVDLAGSFWNGYVDEWWRGGDPGVHGAGGEPRSGAPDGYWNPGWSGLFRAVRTGVEGLDSVLPRPAFHSLAKAWGGEPLDEMSLVGSPILMPNGVVNGAGGLPILARGGLVDVAAFELTPSTHQPASLNPLPLRLGSVSLCLGGYPAPLYQVGPEGLRAQVPWEVEEGLARVVAYRAGIAGNAQEVDVRRAAPGLLPGAVYRPGLPCPVDEFNGAAPGSYLEIYGSGLGEGVAALETGSAAPSPMQTAVAPRARMNAREVEVSYSGFFPGAPGVYQTNIRIPEDFPPGASDLRLEADGVFSNPHRLTVLNSSQRPIFGLGPITPAAIVVQEGGPAQTAHVEVVANHGFCDVVRFLIRGLPAGVRATIPVGVPGEFLPIRVWAEVGAARVERAPITIEGVSTVSAAENVRNLFVTVLPGSGDIELRVVSGGWLSGNPLARFELEGRSIHETFGGGPGRGFNFLTMDALTGAVSPVRTFDTWGDPAAVEAMERYLMGLRTGDLVLGAIADDGALLLTERTREILADTLGSELIGQLEYQWSWAIIARAGAARPMAEGAGRNSQVALDRVVSFPLE